MLGTPLLGSFTGTLLLRGPAARRSSHFLPLRFCSRSGRGRSGFDFRPRRRTSHGFGARLRPRCGLWPCFRHADVLTLSFFRRKRSWGRLGPRRSFTLRFARCGFSGFIRWRLARRRGSLRWTSSVFEPLPRGVLGTRALQLFGSMFFRIRRHHLGGRVWSNNVPPLQDRWAWRSHHGRCASVCSVKQTGVVARDLDVFALQRRGCEMLFLGDGSVRSGRTSLDAASSAIVADVVHRLIDDDGFLIDVSNRHTPHVVDRAVVEELATIPAATFVANARIAEAIVDAAIKADALTPIARVENVGSRKPPPVARGP
ncbi:hypothetical protein AOQ73_09340 [Bradyrhizobium pachyrhizi]|nr:hypothetical protein AOQ73_09340 [Bradyrhizobium pachyrhizi]